MRSPSFKYIVGGLAVLCSLLTKLSAQPPNCNSVPSITGFTPAFGPSNTLVTINGNNFDPVGTNNKVYLGATKATVMASSANSLTVSVPTGSTFFPISVSNTCQLTAISKDPFIISFSCGDTLFNNCFLHETDLATDQSPVDLGAADIDLNGKPDLVCINNGAASFSVIANSSIIGSFAFLPRTDFSTLIDPIDLELKDFDGDGLIDVCVLSSTMSTVSFFRNLSTVNNMVFAPAINIPVPVNTGQFSLNDIDNDGKLDLISSSGNTISVSLNVSLNGALLFLPNVNYIAGSTISSFTTYDLDGDQKVDLALSTGIGGSGAVEIFKNNSNQGSVNFSAAINYPNGAGPNQIIAGDLDNDGKGEIVTSNPQNPFLIIYKNSSVAGNIQLNAPVFVGTNSLSHTVSMANVDGDTKPDLVFSNVLFNTVSVIKNLSGLQFTPSFSFNTGSNPVRIAIVDLDGDHKPEINTANATDNTITVLRNAITKPTRPRVTLGASPTPICQGDFVTFTASTTDGGQSPFYTWRINSTPIFNNLPVFITGLLNNQDTVWVKMTSSLSCAVPNADSAYIVVTINPNLLSSVSLSASANNVCQGTPITFTATPVNGGNANYAWRKNNLPVGNNSPTFSSSALVNGDTIWVKTISSLPCTYPGVDSAYIVVHVLSAVVPQVLLSANSTTVCAGTPVNFTATATNGGSNPVYRWRRNGITVGSNTATFSASNLNNQDSIWVTMTSNQSCATPVSDSAFIIITVNPVSTPAVGLTASATTICQGAPVTFTATPANGGSPTYVWRKNGNPVGTNSPTFTTNAIVDQDTIWVKMISSLACTTRTADSAYVIITVSPTLVPSVTLTANLNPCCQGAPVTFTATSTNGGSPAYQWRKNNTPVGTNSPTFTTTAINDQDTIWVKMVSSISCASPNADSTYIIMTVNPLMPPSVSLTASSTTVCAGSPVNFMATGNNGGSNPVYRWRKNGVPVGINANTFTSSSISNQDTIWVTMISNHPCASPGSDSAFIIITVTPVSTVAVNLVASATTVCQGTAVNFTANATNGGNNPVYSWRKNGIQVGTNSPTFTTTALSNQDTVWVKMISSIACPSQTADSAYVIITISPTLTATVGISASANTVCQGVPVIFTASPVNGGTAIYSWRKNGIPVGTNSSTFTTSSINNQDTIWVKMNSSLSCASPNADSAYIIMTVNPLIPPTVSLAASATTICAGSQVNFTATGNNGGTNPVYSWRRNGIPVGTNSTTFNAANLNDRDTIWVTMTSNYPCASPGSDSTYIIINVTPISTPSVSLTASTTTICQGAPISFTATPTNAGVNPVFSWRKNGMPVGTNLPTFTSNAINDQDTIWVRMVSSLSCISRIADSAFVIINVNPLIPPSVSLAASTTTVCAGSPVNFTATVTNAGTNPVYSWRRNGTPVGTNASTFIATNLINQDTVWVTMTSNHPCASPRSDSSYIIITVTPNSVPAVGLTSSATTICQGETVSFGASPTNGGNNPIYSWRKNGMVVGTNSPTYTTNSINDQDTIWVKMHSNLPCVSPGADSTYIIISVMPLITPSVALTASATSICPGTPVNFSAVAVNGGNTPSFSWSINSTPAGTNSASFTSSTLANQDTVWVTMNSSLACANPVTTRSYVIQSVIPSLPASVNIATSTNPVCQGSPVTFTALPTNGGTAPAYTWQVNGVPAAASNSPVFMTSTLAQGDRVEVILTSNLSCASPATAISNAVTMTVSPILSPSVSIIANPNPICPSVATTFIANITNAGSSYSLQWFRNNIALGGSSSSITLSDLKPNDIIYTRVTSNSPCASPAQAVSNQLSVVIDDASCPKEIYVPTGFTPNNDGRNDLLKPIIRGHVVSYSFTIYNRWGEKVFEAFDPAKAWDGKYKGVGLDTQVFVWYCRYQFLGRPKEMVKGTVSLIR